MSTTVLSKFFMAGAIGVVLTWISYLAGMIFGWVNVLEVNPVEVLAVFTSYMCTYMCVIQTRWNYPVGVVSTALYSGLFFSQGMTALAVFNLYLVGSLAYGWFRWGPDTKSRPITTVSGLWSLGYVFLGLVVASAFIAMNYFFGTNISSVEIWITALSAVAQFMLDNKKIETWAFWIVVNVLSIWYFFNAELYLVTFQYVFFLLNAIWGWFRWAEARHSEDFVDFVYRGTGANK